jgi:Tfp pilus assembly protein PilF
LFDGRLKYQSEIRKCEGVIMIHSMTHRTKCPARAKNGDSKRPAAVLAVALAAACLLVGAGGAQAADAKKQEISRVIAKEMTAAQKALQAQQWQEAIKNLEAANQKPGLTAFDKKSIHDFEGYSYIKLNNYKMAEQEFEAALASGAYTPEEAAKTTRTLFRLAAQNQQYAKATEFGKQVADSGAATADDLGVMAQLYYLQKDCKDSGVWADKAIAAARKAGEAPKENLYQFKLQCASDAGDTAGMDAVLTDLIKLNNKTTYWNTLLRIERQDERDDHNTLMIYRIMYNTNSMNADTDYIEMAQLLGDAALPGEAAAVLDKAMSTGVIKDEHKERTNRLLTALKSRADTDRKGLPQQEAEANKSPSGELLVKLGEVYYGFGEYQKTVDAINAALQKGQIKHQDEAYVYLGLAEVQLKNTAEAKKAFAKLKDVPNISPRVLKLWLLYASTLGMSSG